MIAWMNFALAWAVMLLSHAVPVQPAIRARLTAMLGPRGYLLAYIFVSVLVLIWLVAAAIAAPRVMLWWPAPWTRWVPLVVMLPVCALVTYAVGAPNPLSFGGAHPERFDPGTPGIAGVARHPLLWALALWGAAHLLANGELALVILFGSTAGFSLLGMVMIDRRQRRQRGEAAWQALSVRTSAVPLAAWLTGRWRPKGRPDRLRGGLAVLLWATLIALHSRIIGMPALPPALWW